MSEQPSDRSAAQAKRPKRIERRLSGLLILTLLLVPFCLFFGSLSRPPAPAPSARPVWANPVGFPSTAIAILANGSSARLDALQSGDRIVVATASGALTTDLVSFASIAKPEAELRPFLKKGRPFLTITTQGGKTLTVTAQHHVPTGAASCCSTLKIAREIQVGDTIWIAGGGTAGSAGGTLSPAIVAKTGTALRPGLYSPVMRAGHFPVINGFVTSFDSMGKVALASYVLPTLEVACTAVGACGLVRSALVAE